MQPADHENQQGETHPAAQKAARTASERRTAQWLLEALKPARIRSSC